MTTTKKKKIRGTRSGVWALPPKSGLSSARTPSIIERRAFVRHFCEIGVLVDSWPAQVASISEGGFKIIIPRRFEVGTILKVEIALPTRGDYTMLLDCVVHVAQETNGSWSLGCSFTQPISKEEVQELLTDQ